MSLDLDTAIPCGLVLNELVSNALEHAFPDSRHGVVRVDLHADGGQQIRLCVEDDGVGLPSDVDYRDTPSLGLQMVNMLVSQMEGSIALNQAGGTRFVITLNDQHRQPDE